MQLCYSEGVFKVTVAACHGACAMSCCNLFPHMQDLVPVTRDVIIPFEYHRYIIGQKGREIRALMEDHGLNIAIPPPEKKVLCMCGGREGGGSVMGCRLICVSVYVAFAAPLLRAVGCLGGCYTTVEINLISVVQPLATVCVAVCG